VVKIRNFIDKLENVKIYWKFVKIKWKNVKIWLGNLLKLNGKMSK
jgi:hypothetical protein